MECRKVALIYDARLSYDVKVMIGVAAYAHEQGAWRVYIEEKSLRDQHLPSPRFWAVDGIIANFDDLRVAADVLNSKKPAVAFGGGYSWHEGVSKIPYFLGDDEAIAKLAAVHLLNCGFRRFAYCGYAQKPVNVWSAKRGCAFAEQAAQAGASCDVYVGDHNENLDWTAPQRSMGTWLARLPKPCGLMASDDRRGRQVLEACRSIGLRVPEDVAVIGVDNDELFCQLSSPALSSVEHGAKQLGYQAAAMLDDMMDGREISPSRVVVDPVGVKARESTNVFAVEDPTVGAAITFIFAHACKGIKVQQVLNAVGMSRSGLEKRFKAAVGSTIHTTIRQVQLERVRRLVSETKLPLKQIAAKTGFRSVQHMTTTFGQAFGQPPGGYRRTAIT